NAHKYMFKVTRPDAYTDSDGKDWGVWIQDGVPQADMDVQRNQFMYPDVIKWTGQRYILNNSSANLNETYSCETFYTSHKSEFINIGEIGRASCRDSV